MFEEGLKVKFPIYSFAFFRDRGAGEYLQSIRYPRRDKVEGPFVFGSASLSRTVPYALPRGEQRGAS